MNKFIIAIISISCMSIFNTDASAEWNIFGKHDDNDKTFKLFTQGEEREITSIKDLTGHYLLSYHRAPVYSTGQFSSHSCTVSESENENEIIFNLKIHSTSINLKGVVDIEKKEVTLYSQEGNVDDVADNHSEIGFQIKTGVSSDRMWSSGTKENDFISAKIDDAGSIIFSPEFYMNIYTITNSSDNSEKNVELLEYLDEIRFTRKEIFKFDENEWVYIGEATLTDESFVSNYIGSIPVESYVSLYHHKRNHDRYLLKSPYADQQWSGLTNSLFDGGIIYYTYYPDFIFTDIMTPLGINISDNESASLENEIFAVNNETRYIFSYYADREEILKEADQKSFELSSIKDNVLRLVVSGENLNNPFGIFPYGYSQIHINKGVLNIKLPENGIPAAVHGLNSMEEMPVRYYNLLGTEIKNPEPGDIIIKVVGNKSEKVLIDNTSGL